MTTRVIVVRDVNKTQGDAEIKDQTGVAEKNGEPTNPLYNRGNKL